MGSLRLGSHNYTAISIFTRDELEEMVWVHVAQDREKSALLLTRLSKLAFH